MILKNVYRLRSLRIAVGITMLIIITIGVAAAPASITIGNGPWQPDGSYLNAQSLATSLVYSSIIIQANSIITIEDNVNLASSPYGTPFYDLTLSAPTIYIKKNMIMSPYGSIFMTATTLNLSDRITSGGTAINPTRIIGTATQVNVLNNGASIQQGMDFSSRTAPVTVRVGAGQYNENLMIKKALTLGGDVGTGADGAGVNAPKIFGTIAGGNVITVTGNNVRIEGMHLNAQVGDGSVVNSINGIAANGVDNLNVNHNTFEGFQRSAMSILNSTNVFISANYFIPHITSINVTPNPTNLVVGDIQTFTASPKDQYDADFPATITWSSSNTTVGTVDPNSGEFTSHVVGTTMVNATNGSVNGTAFVTVERVPPHITSINVTPNPTNMIVGDTQTFTASSKDQYDADFPATMTWSSSNTTVGTVDPNSGEFTANVVGTTMVNATNGSVSASASVTVQIAPVLPSIRFINGTVIDSEYKTGISGVKVSANSTLSTTTNSTGFYSFSVTDGSYDLKATFDIRYYTNTTTVSTFRKVVAWTDIELVKKPTGNITGSVTRCC